MLSLYCFSLLFLFGRCNYKQYKGFEYPILTIPKGTILYNYDRGKNAHIKDIGIGTYDGVKLVIERTKSGMLVSYFQHNVE